MADKKMEMAGQGVVYWTWGKDGCDRQTAD